MWRAKKKAARSPAETWHQQVTVNQEWRLTPNPLEDAQGSQPWGSCPEQTVTQIFVDVTHGQWASLSEKSNSYSSDTHMVPPG